MRQFQNGSVGPLWFGMGWEYRLLLFVDQPVARLSLAAHGDTGIACELLEKCGMFFLDRGATESLARDDR